MLDHIFILLAASMAAVNCSLIGSFLVLRKMSMMSDAISHSILPGIVAAVLITGSRSPLVVVLGASVVGLLTTFLIEYAHKKIKLQIDASTGINFTWLFALGIILISIFSKKVDLDPECVIFGEIAYIPLDVWVTKSGLNMGPRAIYVLVFIFIINISFVCCFYKQLKITTFDPQFAASLGINTTLWHYLLIFFTSITVVASFEIAGAILVVSLIVIPTAAAYLISRDLKAMLIHASMIGAVSSLFGYILSIIMDGSIVGAIATTLGIAFAIIFIADLSRKKI